MEGLAGLTIGRGANLLTLLGRVCIGIQGTLGVESWKQSTRLFEVYVEVEWEISRNCLLPPKECLCTALISCKLYTRSSFEILADVK